MSKFCPHCGKQVDENTTFCPYCGGQVNQQARSSPKVAGNPGGSAGSVSATPGKGKAIASLVLGIVAIVFAWFGYSSIVSMIAGVAGLILASIAKRDGFEGGYRTAGFVLSLIGLILGAIMFVACVSCLGFIYSL